MIVVVRYWKTYAKELISFIEKELPVLMENAGCSYYEVRTEPYRKGYDKPQFGFRIELQGRTSNYPPSEYLRAKLDIDQALKEKFPEVRFRVELCHVPVFRRFTHEPV